MDVQKKLVLKILDITKTESDKETFADIFTNLIFEETVYTLIRSLPKARQESASKKWDANVDNPAALVSFLKHYFTQEQIEQASEKVAEKAMQDYLKSIDDKLTDDQRRELVKLAESMALK